MTFKVLPALCLVFFLCIQQQNCSSGTISAKYPMMTAQESGTRFGRIARVLDLGILFHREQWNCCKAPSQWWPASKCAISVQQIDELETEYYTALTFYNSAVRAKNAFESASSSTTSDALQDAYLASDKGVRPLCLKVPACSTEMLTWGW